MRSDNPFYCFRELCDSTFLARWFSSLPTNTVLQVAVIIAVALAAITALLMAQAMFVSELATWRGRRRLRFNETWRPFFAVCSLSDELPMPLPKLARGQRLWLLLQWNRTQLQLRGAARIRMNTALRALGLEAFVLALLKRRVSSRLIGLTCLRHLADVQHWQVVEALIRNNNPIVALSAAQALIAMDATRAMQLLTPVLLARPDWALLRLASLCQQAGSEAVTAPLLAALKQADIATVRRAAALLGWAQPRQTAAWARAMLDQEGLPELLQAALKSLGELGDPRDRDRLIRRLHHGDANVRLTAVQSLRSLARPTDIDIVSPLLSDRSWSVRQAAAAAIAALPGIAPERLTQLSAAIEDPAGQEALKRAIAEVYL